MLLSALVSQLEPDGSLVVDLADEHGPVLRFGPLAHGMLWARLEGGAGEGRVTLQLLELHSDPQRAPRRLECS